MNRSQLTIQKLENSLGTLENFSGKVQKFNKRKWASSKKVERKLYKASTQSHKKRLYPLRLNYKYRLQEKQFIRAFYGNISNKHLKSAFTLKSLKKESFELKTLRTLETRLDTILYRSGFGSTLFEIRQYISHGYFLVNQRRVYNKNISLKEGDIFQVDDKYKTLFLKKIVGTTDSKNLNEFFKPAYLEIDLKSLRGILVEDPKPSTVYYNKSANMVLPYLFYTR